MAKAQNLSMTSSTTMNIQFNSFSTPQVPENGIAWNNLQYINYNYLWNHNIPFLNYNLRENYSSSYPEPAVVQELHQHVSSCDPSYTIPSSLLNYNPDGIDLLDSIDDFIPNIEVNSENNSTNNRSITAESPVLNGQIEQAHSSTSSQTGPSLIQFVFEGNQLKRVDANTAATSPIIETCLLQEGYKKNPPRTEVQKSEHASKHTRTTKMVSSNSTKEDIILNEYLSKRVYRRTLVRPKKRSAPSPSAEAPKAKIAKNSENKFNSSSKLEDDTLDFAKFTKSNSGVIIEDNKNNCSGDRDEGNDTVLSDITIGESRRYGNLAQRHRSDSLPTTGQSPTILQPASLENVDPLAQLYSPISPASPRKITNLNMETYSITIGPANPQEDVKRYAVPNQFPQHLSSGILKNNVEADSSWIRKFEWLVPHEYLLSSSNETATEFYLRRARDSYYT